VKRPIAIAPGVHFWPGYLDMPAQLALVTEVFRLAQQAPFYHATMPRTGHPLSVGMTNFGPLGWYSDRFGGYRYEANHPVLGTPWPDIPTPLLNIWSDTTGYPAPPEACKTLMHLWFQFRWAIVRSSGSALHGGAQQRGH